MKQQKCIPLDEANTHEADVRLWQEAKIRAGLKDAAAGRFASQAEVKAVMQKFIPNG